jgi:hypothetical protein
VESIETAGAFGAGEGLLGDSAGAFGALAQDGVDVVRVRGEFGTAGAGRGEVAPVALEQLLLQVAVSESAGAEAVFGGLGDLGRRDEAKELDGDVLVGIGLGFGASKIIAEATGGPTLTPLWWVAVASLSSALVGVISGFYPAWKASKLDPIEALRYE